MWTEKMTESEWLASTDYKRMANHLYGRVSERKERLFLVACCRRLWCLFGRPAAREAILVAERYADGEAGDEELAAARRTLLAARAAQPIASPHGRAYHVAAVAAASSTSSIYSAVESAFSASAVGEVQGAADLIREFFGNPFREPRFETAWRSPAVVAMAQGIYNEHDFGSMPILADALEDAGCDERELLSHCRGGGPHHRGCWALDLILSR